MSCRVIIRHSTGSKASTAQELPVIADQELIFGREPGCDIQYDKDRDEFVSRRHMKLVIGDPGRLEFTVVELSARNGTFVNRRRVQGRETVKPGDIVQLGAGGPEFVFDVAREDLKETPVSVMPPVIPEEPPKIAVAPPQEANDATPPPKSLPKRRAAAKEHSANKRVAGIVTVIVVASAAVIYGIGRAEVPALEKVRTAARNWFGPKSIEVPRVSLMTFENRWSLLDESGRPLRQIYIPNRQPAGDGPLVPGVGQDLPVFVVLGVNRIEPLLTVSDRTAYKPITGIATGAGFAASPGLALTSLVVAHPWDAPYAWPAADSAGVAVVFNDDGTVDRTAVIARRQFPDWIPARAEFGMEEAFDGNAANVSRRIKGKPASQSLTVRGESGEQTMGKLVTISESLGIAAFAAPAASAPVSIAEESSAHSGERVRLVTRAGIKAGQLSLLPDGGYAVTDIGSGSREAGTPLVDNQGRVLGVQIVGEPGAAIHAAPIRRVLDSIPR